jgi:hypothetical protein
VAGFFYDVSSAGEVDRNPHNMLQIYMLQEEMHRSFAKSRRKGKERAIAIGKTGCPPGMLLLLAARHCIRAAQEIDYKAHFACGKIMVCLIHPRNNSDLLISNPGLEWVPVRAPPPPKNADCNLKFSDCL